MARALEGAKQKSARGDGEPGGNAGMGALAGMAKMEVGNGAGAGGKAQTTTKHPQTTPKTTPNYPHFLGGRGAGRVQKGFKRAPKGSKASPKAMSMATSKPDRLSVEGSAEAAEMVSACAFERPPLNVPSPPHH